MARLLAVDDDDDIRALIAIRLERAGHDVTSLGDPLHALALAESASFDMAILDWSMPVMNGGELCARLRELPHFESRPILIVTAHNDLATRDRAHAAGASGYLAKPFALQALVDQVERGLAALPSTATRLAAAHGARRAHP